MNQKPLLNRTIFIHLIPVTVILCWIAYHIKDNTVIKIVGDEYGYWAAGSYFAGLNWAELTSINPYYGYGYGLILSVLLRLPFSSVTLYRLAIILNGIFLCIIYIIIFTIASELMDSYHLRPATICSISCLITFQTANLYYTQYTLSEGLLALLYWAIVYLAFRMHNHISVPSSLCFILLNVFLFFVHMRTAGIVIVSLLFMIWCLWKQKAPFKHCICLLIIIPIMGGIGFWAKHIYQEMYWIYAASTNTSVNDISSQSKNIMFLFTAEGIRNFFYLSMGYLYYSFSATCLLAIPTCLFSYKRIVLYFRQLFNGGKRLLCKADFPILFCFLSWFSTVAVAAVFMASSINARGDITLYGRYFEFTLGPLILISICKLIEYAEQKKYGLSICINTILVYCIISKIVDRMQNYNADKSHFFISTSALYCWLEQLDFSPKSLLVISLGLLGVFLIGWLFVFSSKGNNFVIMVLSILFSCVVMYKANYTYEHGCLSWAVDQLEFQLELAEYIDSKEINDQIYYYWKDEALKADILQFILKDDSIHTVYNLQDFIDEHPAGYLLVPAETSENTLISYNFLRIYHTPILSLWRYGGAINE